MELEIKKIFLSHREKSDKYAWAGIFSKITCKNKRLYEQIELDYHLKKR